MAQPSDSLHRRTPISVRSEGSVAAETAPEPAQGAGRTGPGSLVSVLIGFGIPLVLVAAGVVGVVLWLRVDPPVSQLSAVLPTASGSAARGAMGAFTPPDCGTAQPGMPTGTPQTPVARPGTQMSIPSPGAEAGQAPGFVLPAPGSGGRSGPSVSAGAATVPSLPGSWPGFRGPDLDNISKESTSLATSWGPQGPKTLWSVQLGEGHAGAAVLNGRVYVLDYDQTNKADKLRCLSLADGGELWSHSSPVVVKRNHGMSRTVPAVTGSYVVALGPKCDVICADATTGSVKWTMDLVDDWGAKVPTWYAGQCPLIDGEKVILAPAGKALMIAVDLASGKTLWQAPNPNGWKMTHSSIRPTTIAGRKVYLYCASGGVAAVSASDGAILWETKDWTVSTANIPTPVPIGDGRVLLCGGYNAGSMMIRLRSSGGKLTHEELYRLPAKTFGSDQHTPILYKGHIYGVIPSGELACLGLDGKRLWTSGRTARFGIGPYMIAGGMIYALSATGEMSLVKATPEGYQPLARANVLKGPDAWAPIAIAGGRLLARDLTTMVCLDVARS